MVRYLESEVSEIEKRLENMFKTANTVMLTARCWYRVLLTYLSHKDSLFFVGPFLEKVPRVPGRRFPMVEHPFVIEDKSVRWTRVVIVEVMDLGDPQRSWDVKNSDVYEEIRDIDPAHPERKTFGALSAGTNFILFEVTGKEDPVFLLGSPETPADFFEDAESLENVMHRIYQVAIARECKCPDAEEVTFEEAASANETVVVRANADPPPVAECIPSTSSAPSAKAEVDPTTLVSDTIGRAVGTESISTTATADGSLVLLSL